MTVPSPKTSRHEGHEDRTIPLWPELLPHLQRQFDAARPGDSHVIVDHRCDDGAKLRRQAHRIIRHAGLTPWPKTFHNLRASRSTELFSQFPEHVAEAWMGHRRAVARKHYHQVTESDFQKAVQKSVQSAMVRSVLE